MTFDSPRRRGSNSTDGARGRRSSSNKNREHLTGNSGMLKFEDATNTEINIAKFLKVKSSTEPAEIVEFMCHKWGMKPPRLLISVTGGAKNVTLNGKLRDAFRRGLVMTSLSTDAWIISGGTHAGVMKYVGEAVRDYGIDDGKDVVAIGIATWGVLTHKDKMEELLADRSGRSTAGEKSFSYDVSKQEKERTSLDPNHTHFILVDSGHSRFGGEVDLTAKFCQYLIEKKSVNLNLCVLVGGGPNSLKTVDKAIESNTHVVVIRGSGRIADILADAYDANRDGREWKECAREHLDHPSMRAEHLGVEDFIVIMETCLKNKDAITIWSANDELDLSRTILKGFFNAANAKWKTQVEIAMIWNRPDMAEKKLFDPHYRQNQEDLFDLFCKAVRANKLEFVQLFLQHGLSVQRHLTHSRLEDLYNMIDRNSMLYHLLRQTSKEKVSRFKLDVHVELLIKQTLSGYVRPTASPQRVDRGYRFTSISLDDDELLSQTTDRYASSSRSESDLFRYPFQELFFYAVLQDRFDMAKLFWKKCKEPIAAALTACNILKNVASANQNLYEDECADMLKNAEKMETLAVSVLDVCQDANAAKTEQLLEVTRPNWSSTSCLKMAFSAPNYNFASQNSVQNVVNKLWHGDISKNTSFRLIWLATCFPPFIWLISFNDEKSERTGHWHHEVDDKATEDSAGRALPGIPEELETGNGEPVDVETNVDGEVDQEDIFLQEMQNNGAHAHRPSASSVGSERDQLDTVTRSAWGRVKSFYSSPTVKFRYHLLSYLVFLGLFSYVMLVDFHEKISMTEMVVIAWVVTIFCDEIRQILEADRISFKEKVKRWYNDTWNRMDMLNLALFLVGFILRFFPSTFVAARIILCVDLLFFFVRVLNSFLVVKSLGPKLLMIEKMMVDLGHFIFILLVFLLSYGIASQSILYPNHPDPDAVIRGVLYRAYFQVFGELYIDAIEGESGCTTNSTMIDMGRIPCPENSWAGLLLLGLYMLISNVLLLNLLIAMFGYTFQIVQENTDAYWKFHRYELIREYIKKPILVPPFIILEHIYRVLQYCSDTNISNEQDKQEDYVSLMTLMKWECLQLESFLAKQREESDQEIEMQVQNFTQKLEKIEECSALRMHNMEKQLVSVNERVDSMYAVLNQQLALLKELTNKKDHETP